MDKSKITMALALKKIDEQMEIITSRNNYYASDYAKYSSGNTKYDALIRKHKIEYNTKYARNKEVISKVKLFMANKYNQFDKELFKLLQIVVSFKGDSYHRYAGWIWPDDIKMIINIQDYLVRYNCDHDWIYEVTAHELGHLWSYQLSRIAGLKYSMINKIAINKYLFLKGLIPNEKSRISFEKLKPILQENLSSYSGKSNTEAFAELFSLSCFNAIHKEKSSSYSEKSDSEAFAEIFSLPHFNTIMTHFDSRNSEDILIAKQVIKEINIILNQAILKKCFKYKELKTQQKLRFKPSFSTN